MAADDQESLPDGVHHLNIAVRDLDEAIRRYGNMLGVGEPIREMLPSRGVETARFPLGTSWLILVAPTAEDSVVSARLASHGEGPFLLSLRVGNLELAANAARIRGVLGESASARIGLDGWRVIDLDVGDAGGMTFQICEDGSRAE